MRDWKFWDWATYGTLGSAVFFLALKEGVDRLPQANVPEFLTGPIWAFLPLALFLIGTVILICRGLGWIGPAHRKDKNFVIWPISYRPIAVLNQKFANDRVVLDGHSYVGCNFENVTFIYNGTTAIQFNRNEVHGKIRFHSDNPAVLGTIMMLFGFGCLSEKFEILTDLPIKLERPTK